MELEKNRKGKQREQEGDDCAGLRMGTLESSMQRLQPDLSCHVCCSCKALPSLRMEGRWSRASHGGK